MATVLGLACKLYRNTGTYASPVWDLIGNVRDLTLTLEKGEADSTSRANNGWRTTEGTLKDGSVEFQMVWDGADTDFTGIQQAFLNNTTIEFLILDGASDVAGSQGLRATMQVMSFTRNEALEDTVLVDVTLKPARATNAPAWYTVPTP